MCARPVIIGLLGGLAAGKSSVAGIFADLGATVIDADRIAHETLARPEVIPELVDLFGPDALDGEGRPDRVRIGGLAFADRRKLRRLEALLHPRILARMREELGAVREAPVVVLDAPLLLEAGLDDLADVLVFVQASERAREDRAVAGRRLRPGERKNRERHQAPPEEKRKKADHVIVNEGTREELRATVRALYRAILKAKGGAEEG